MIFVNVKILLLLFLPFDFLQQKPFIDLLFDHCGYGCGFSKLYYIFIGSVLFHNSQITLFDCINIDLKWFIFYRFALPHRGRMVKSRTRRETDKLELMRSQVFRKNIIL